MIKENLNTDNSCALSRSISVLTIKSFTVYTKLTEMAVFVSNDLATAKNSGV